MRRINVVVAAALTAGMVVGTSGIAGAKAANKSPIIVGATGSFTGAIAAASQSYLNGLEIALDAANAAGGIAGHPITVKTYDDGGVAAQGVVNTRTAITVTNVLVVCCGVFSTVTTEADPLWQQYQTPGFSEGAPAGTLTSPGNAGNPYEFVSDLNAGTGEWQQEIAVIAKLAAKENISSPKVAIAALASPSGAAAATAFTKAAQAKGWTVTTTQQVSLTGTNITGPAAQLVASHPDFVAATAAGTGELPFLQALENDGLTVPIVDYSSGVVASIFLPLNDPNLYGLLAWKYPGGSTKAVQKYLSLATKYHLDASGQLTPSGYAAGLMLVAALKKCGPSCTRPQLLQKMDSLKGFTGTGFFAGPLTMAKTNHNAFQQADVVHVVTGRIATSFTVNGTTVSTASG